MRRYTHIAGQSDLPYWREHFEERIATFLDGATLTEAVKANSAYALRRFPVALTGGVEVAYALEDWAWFEDVATLSCAFAIQAPRFEPSSRLDLYDPLMHGILAGNSAFLAALLAQLDQLPPANAPPETPTFAFDLAFLDAVAGLQRNDESRTRNALTQCRRLSPTLAPEARAYVSGLPELIAATLSGQRHDLATAAHARAEAYHAYAQRRCRGIFDASAFLDEEGAVVLTLAHRRGLVVDGGTFADAAFFCR